MLLNTCVSWFLQTAPSVDAQDIQAELERLKNENSTLRQREEVLRMEFEKNYEELRIELANECDKQVVEVIRKAEKSFGKEFIRCKARAIQN